MVKEVLCFVCECVVASVGVFGDSSRGDPRLDRNRYHLNTTRGSALLELYVRLDIFIVVLPRSK